MRLIFYILFFYSLLYNSLFAMLESQLIEEFERIDSLSNLPESQRIENRKEMNKMLENANAKLRLKFTSDKNFEKFKLLQKAASFEDVGLIVKFLNAAIGNNTISKEEVQMFCKCKKNVEVQLIKDLYHIESHCEEVVLGMDKIAEDVREVCEDLDNFIEQKKRKERKREQRITSRISRWICYFFGDTNQASMEPEINLENVETTEIMFQKDMDEKEKTEQLEEEKKKQERDISNLELV